VSLTSAKHRNYWITLRIEILSKLIHRGREEKSAKKPGGDKSRDTVPLRPWHNRITGTEYCTYFCTCNLITYFNPNVRVSLCQKPVISLYNYFCNKFCPYLTIDKPYCVVQRADTNFLFGSRWMNVAELLNINVTWLMWPLQYLITAVQKPVVTHGVYIKCNQCLYLYFCTSNDLDLGQFSIFSNLFLFLL
jgi:hypothetical protein